MSGAATFKMSLADDTDAGLVAAVVGAVGLVHAEVGRDAFILAMKAGILPASQPASMSA